jgi:hypothetical protein
MDKIDGHEPRIGVWESMAEHFLDSETRQDIPITALRCVQAGLSTDQARHIWKYEVSPAVGLNLWCVAGEWGAWDRDWLVQTIVRIRNQWARRPALCRWLRYRLRIDPAGGVWVSIARCMDALRMVPSASGREQMAKDLTFLARHCFDFCPDDLASLEPAARQRIRSLYPEPFRRIIATALVSREFAVTDERVRAVLAQEEAP